MSGTGAYQGSCGGAPIPAYDCLECGYTMVEYEKPSQCPVCRSENIKQDEDVLDTWFSSALWPFSTLGWPEDTEISGISIPPMCL